MTGTEYFGRACGIGPGSRNAVTGLDLIPSRARHEAELRHHNDGPPDPRGRAVRRGGFPARAADARVARGRGRHGDALRARRPLRHWTHALGGYPGHLVAHAQVQVRPITAWQLVASAWVLALTVSAWAVLRWVRRATRQSASV